MLNLKYFLRLGRPFPDAILTAEAIKPSLSSVYFRPTTVSELLATTCRQQWLRSCKHPLLSSTHFLMKDQS